MRPNPALIVGIPSYLPNSGETGFALRSNWVLWDSTFAIDVDNPTPIVQRLPSKGFPTRRRQIRGCQPH